MAQSRIHGGSFTRGGSSDSAERSWFEILGRAGEGRHLAIGGILAISGSGWRLPVQRETRGPRSELAVMEEMVDTTENYPEKSRKVKPSCADYARVEAKSHSPLK